MIHQNIVSVYVTLLQIYYVNLMYRFPIEIPPHRLRRYRMAQIIMNEYRRLQQNNIPQTQSIVVEQASAGNTYQQHTR
jgi:hypothetical protein